MEPFTVLVANRVRQYQTEDGHSFPMDASSESMVYVITARKRSLREGYVFTPVCDSVNRGGRACHMTN